MGVKKSHSGRAVSAAIVERLRAALVGGAPRTAGDLARTAHCTERTVRNYLAVSPDAFGFAVERVRGRDGRVRWRAREATDAATVEQAARVLASELLRPIFPIAGTSLDAPARRPHAQLLVAPRGAFEYGEEQLRAVRAWIVAASKRPRVALRFPYGALETGAGERIVWPLGIVVRDAVRVYLAGVPAEATRPDDVHTYAVERVQGPMSVVPVAEAGAAPDGIDGTAVEDAIDMPFSIHSQRTPDTVRVHVRFTAAQAPYVRGRRWHRTIKQRTLGDGRLEVRFGPCDANEAAAWVCQWGESVEVLGDAELRERVRAWVPRIADEPGSGTK